MQVYQKTEDKASATSAGYTDTDGRMIKKRLVARRAFLVALKAGKKVEPPDGFEVPSWWPKKQVVPKVDNALHVHSNTVQGLKKTVHQTGTGPSTGPSK